MSGQVMDQDFTDRNRTIDCIDPLDVVYEKSNSSGLSDGWAVVHVSPHPGLDDNLEGYYGIFYRQILFCQV